MMNISASQSSSARTDIKHEIVTIPSTSQPTFGGTFTIDFREQNCAIKDLMLQFSPSAISDTGNIAYFCPTPYWITRIELYMNGQAIQTFFSDELFLSYQIWLRDEQRKLHNSAIGDYSSGARRLVKNQALTQWYLPIWSICTQANLEVLSQSHLIQLKVYMNSLANCVMANTGTTTATINSCNLIAKVARFSPEIIQMKNSSLVKAPRHYLYTEARTQSSTIQSGVSTASITLSAITGRISHLMFLVRPTSGLTGDSQFSFVKIANFNINGSDGASLVGGNALSFQLNEHVQGQDWSLSSYLSDWVFATSNSYVNMYSFSEDPIEVMTTGKMLGSRLFNGSEILNVVFTGALASTNQIDIFAYTQTCLAQSLTQIKKITL